MNILVINGHPNPDSLNTAIAQTYIETARALGASVRAISL
ncbi:NAD(P)H-dependent oxidoreductase [Myroides sp. C15-4]